jgi:predicted DsbA family dithiol-disulfide isomerase
MKIDIISDTICPWCFIGKRRLERALAVLEGPAPAITWHPFQLNPDMPGEGMDRGLYLELKFGGAARAHQIYRAVTEAAAGESLAFSLERIARAPNTLASHRLIHYAAGNERQPEVVENLFRAYFLDGRDLGALEVLAEVAGESGLDREAVRRYLDGDDDVELIRARDRHARQIGVTGVPCFIINGSYAVSGAQDPEVFSQVFAVARQEAAEHEVETAG